MLNNSHCFERLGIVINIFNVPISLPKLIKWSTHDGVLGDSLTNKYHYCQATEWCDIIVRGRLAVFQTKLQPEFTHYHMHIDTLTLQDHTFVKQLYCSPDLLKALVTF